jgi:hypothetical protein
MSNLVQYLGEPLKKLFSSRDFRSAVKKYTKPASPTTIPFMDYPPAGITSEGPKFKYTDGVELISYHIKGIKTINAEGSNGFEQYLCSVKIPQAWGGPLIFPGSITGMFQSGGGSDIITTPLANGGLVEVDGVHRPVSNFQINLYNYGDNPQPDGSYNYALVVDTLTEGYTGNVSAIMAYDYEFLLPNFIPAPTIFQD